MDPFGISELDPHPYAYVNSNPLRYTDPLGLRSWPFGAGRFCRDKSCQCVDPPIKIKGEDSPGFVPTPGAGQCVDADAAYSRECVVKIPDHIECTLKCDANAAAGQQGELVCRFKGPLLGPVAHYLLGKKPECFDKPPQIPPGWPPNPFFGGGG